MPFFQNQIEVFQGKKSSREKIHFRIIFGAFQGTENTLRLLKKSSKEICHMMCLSQYIILYTVRGGSIFGAEKRLKEFRSTCLICFANTALVQSICSNLHQKWSFEQFTMHQNCELTRDFSFSLRYCSFGAFSLRN